jgi:hypothetical protein
MTVAAPTLFPFRHDWAQPFKVSREWKTDVETADDGSETRVQLRTNPNIGLTMHIASLTEMIPGRLLAQWRGASQPLRYYAPLWCDTTDLTDPVSAGDAIITLDTTTRPFFGLSPSGVGYAMLWRSEELAEVVSYSELDDTLLVLDAGTVNDYAVAGTRVVPCRPMWLTMPVTVTWLSGRIASADVSFVDQREQAGLGLDGSDTTAAPYSLQIYKKDWGTYGQGAAGFVPFVLDVEAMPFDRLGVPLPGAPVTWSYTDNEPPNNNITITPSSNSRLARVFVNTASGSITAHAAGGVTSTMGVN